MKINTNKESALLQTQLQTILSYDPITGFFWWLEEKRGRDLNTPAGTENLQGYRTISINGQAFRAHRLAWFYMTGMWPPEYVDHIDGNPRNNQWNNLRLATARETAWNKKRKYDSYSGIKGVVKNYINDTWEVHTRDSLGNVLSMGPFYSYKIACKVYDDAVSQFRGDFHRKEKPRQQFAKFKDDDVAKAIEDFLSKEN